MEIHQGNKIRDTHRNAVITHRDAKWTHHNASRRINKLELMLQMEMTGQLTLVAVLPTTDFTSKRLLRNAALLARAPRDMCH